MKITTDFFKQMIETVKKDRKKQIIAAGVVLLIIVLAIVSCGTKGEAKTASSGKAKTERGKNIESGWQVYSKVDQFGDTTDETVLVLKNQKGTYSSVKDGSKDAKLEWEMHVVVDGAVDIILKEKGKEVSLSTLDDPLFDEYMITVKDDNGESYYCSAQIVRNSDIYNVLEIGYTSSIFQALLAKNKNPKIVISSNKGSYSLGAIKTNGFEELAFKKSFLDEANKLIAKGKLEKAKTTLEEYSETYGYDYYMSFGDDEKNYYTKTHERLVLALRKGLNEKCTKEHKFDRNGHYCLVCGYHYATGDIGPAGGYIFYDCDVDNDTGNADGLISSECGWRFLEAAPEELPEMYVWGDDGKLETQTGIGTGKANTGKISATRDGEITAAKACLDYSVNGFDDWFLPSHDEIKAFAEFYRTQVKDLVFVYWSSSSKDYYYDYYDRALTGEEVLFYSESRYLKHSVWPCRAF